MKAYIVEQDRLRANAAALMELAGDAAVYGVVKGDGYGLGLLPLSSLLWDCGIRRLAVTEVHEARALRERFPEAEILMLRETGLPEEITQLMEAGAVLTVGSPETAQAVSRAAEVQGNACPCHVKIDTGMGRYGFFPEDLDGIAAIYDDPNLAVQGIYTHFHSAFSDEKATRAQFEAFQQALAGLEQRGIRPGLRHCCNSSAFLQYPEMRLDGVRLGSALLGRLSFSGAEGLQRVGWCEAQVEVVRTIPKGHTVGYAAGWRAKRNTTIAVCNVGYFHGFGEDTKNDLYRFTDSLVAALSPIKAFLTRKSLWVTVNGTPARVLGHVGMVQTVFDVTDVPCRVGDPIRLEIKPLAVKDMEIIYR